MGATCPYVVEVPIIVNSCVPVGVVDEVLTVSVELPLPPDVSVTVPIENEPVHPTGNPLIDRLTGPLNPLRDVTVTVYIAFAP